MDKDKNRRSVCTVAETEGPKGRQIKNLKIKKSTTTTVNNN